MRLVSKNCVHLLLLFKPWLVMTSLPLRKARILTVNYSVRNYVKWLEVVELAIKEYRGKLPWDYPHT